MRELLNEINTTVAYLESFQVQELVDNHFLQLSNPAPGQLLSAHIERLKNILDKYQDDAKCGFMCKVDWDHELGQALGGNTIYPSQADLVSNKKCTDECGIVEVEVRLKQVIQESDFSIKPDKMYQVSSRDENGKRVFKKISGKEILERKK